MKLGAADVLGFDPGTENGYFCLIRDGKVSTRRIPLYVNGRTDYRALYSLMSELTGPETTIVIEEVWAYPGQGAVSTSKLVESYAAVRAMAEFLSTDIVTYHPKTWKKVWGLPGKKVDEKAAGKLVEVLFPDIAPIFQRMSRKVAGKKLKGLDQNACEAFLLALTPRRLET